MLRVSGPAAGGALSSLAGPLPAPRRATRRRLRDPGTGEILDDALVLWMPGPASFTGEDICELHLHGGRAVLDGVLAALAALPGLRPAEAGEFTRRAFDNDRLDLTAVEGLADLVAAETAAQRRQALRQLDGELGRMVEEWREGVVRALAHLEAAIDFSEEDVPGDLADRVRPALARLRAAIDAQLAAAGPAERLRDGITVVIAGPPNAGKSSLLNRLARRDAAIVATVAGTTRDPIEVHVDLGGFPVTLVDTAGLRHTDDPVEAEGVRRARARAARADLRLLLFDASADPVADPGTLALADADSLLAINKIDLATQLPPGQLSGHSAYPLCLATGQGLDDLLAALGREVAARFAPGAAPALTRARHREALGEARNALDRALAAPLLDLMAEDVRLGARALGRITGRVDVEELLDRIFREFCIGK